MFKSIRKKYVSGTVVVNGVQRVADESGVVTHYIASLYMRLEGKARSVSATFYPEQAKKLCEILGVASLNQNVQQDNTSWATIRVELLDLRKSRLSRTCTAKLISAEFTLATEQKLVMARRYTSSPKLSA